MNKGESLANEAREATEDNVIYGLWLAENASELLSVDSRKRLMVDIDPVITAHFAEVVAEAKGDIEQVADILSHSESLDKDEWLLIVVNMSSAWCVMRAAKRLNLSVELPKFNSCIEKLKCLPQDQATEFKRAVTRSRMQVPSPLPEGLDEI